MTNAPFWVQADPASEPDESNDDRARDLGNDALAVETMRTLIFSSLDALLSYLPQVNHYVDTRQRGLGFLSIEGRAVMDSLVRKERLAQHWNYVHGGIKITGAVPSPVDSTALAAFIDLHAALAGHVSALERRMRRQGVCLIQRMPAEPSIGDLARTLRVQVGFTTQVSLLDPIAEDVERALGKAKRIVEGDDKKLHPKPCPHCHLNTLVIHISKRVIRCEVDPEAGNTEPCICGDAFCPCRRKPIQHRHEWFFQPQTTLQKSIHHLADAQTLIERAATKP